MQNMTQANNPLHGIKLETIITDLVERYGWEELGERIKIRCFTHDPSIKSSLRFLRKTDWAREKVEYLYLKANKLPLPIKSEASNSAPHRAKTTPPKTMASNKTPSSSTQSNPAQSKKPSKGTEPTATDGNVNSHIWGTRD
ncbi:VF530 family DNA-binding protein [Shewanella putrefaciens]|uniref:VF530 family protein n=1 Tax=Shewanella putrefaciens TaxID=24 RepID=UPI0018E6EAC7|nr:VF530 family protein [Shewanella putrefaciens]